MKSLRWAYALVGVACLGVSCTEQEAPKPLFETELSEITSATDGATTITLYADEPFFVGFNQVTAKIENANGELLSGEALVTPLMDMMTMRHACPMEFPNGFQFVDGRFEFNAVFVMPSGDMGNWSLTFAVNGDTLAVPVTVVQPARARLASFVSTQDQTSKYFVALIDPGAPQVGENVMEIGVFKKQTMMDWPAVEDLTIAMQPWMPSMDHGSPNNVDPVHQAAGHYLGKVNFTMTGEWQLRLSISESGLLIGEPLFDIIL
ncbi:MAG: FixH family protein [Cyclobacteriaceae bacterium]|nr:FixH family protein [Cyclobacteriaceae bacterium]